MTTEPDDRDHRDDPTEPDDPDHVGYPNDPIEPDDRNDPEDMDDPGPDDPDAPGSTTEQASDDDDPALSSATARTGGWRRFGRRRPAVVGAVVAVLVLVGVGAVVLAGGSDDGGGGSAACGDDGYLTDDEAGLCFQVPAGWRETPPASRQEIAVSSMLSSGGDGPPASAMAGEWGTLFESAPPDAPEDAAAWMVGESGLFGEGTDVTSDVTEIDGHEAGTATGEIPGDTVIRLQATVVEVASDDVVFLLTVTPAADGDLVAASEDVHDSLAVAAR